jgi:hypothetical protein
MSDTKPAQPGDAKLRMDEAITGRDFLGSVLLASGAALLGSASPAELAAADHFTGYGGVGEYSNSNGNTLEVMQAGHSIRFGTFDPPPKDVIAASPLPTAIFPARWIVASPYWKHRER